MSEKFWLTSKVDLQTFWSFLGVLKKLSSKTSVMGCGGSREKDLASKNAEA